MHWLDILLLLVLAVGAAFGARTGLLRQVARIASFGVALYACLSFRRPALALLDLVMEGGTEVVREAVAGAVTFVVVYGFLYGLTLLLDARLRKSSLKVADRILGAGFGLVKTGLLAGAALLLVAVVADADTESALGRSRLAPVLLRGVRLTLAAVPPSYKEGAEAALDRVLQARDGRTPAAAPDGEGALLTPP